MKMGGTESIRPSLWSDWLTGRDFRKRLVLKRHLC